MDLPTFALCFAFFARKIKKALSQVLRCPLPCSWVDCFKYQTLGSEDSYNMLQLWKALNNIIGVLRNSKVVLMFGWMIKVADSLKLAGSSPNWPSRQRRKRSRIHLFVSPNWRTFSKRLGDRSDGRGKQRNSIVVYHVVFVFVGFNDYSW